MEKYIEADRFFHVASQYLARVNKSYLISADDDSHTSLGFNGLGNRLDGRWINIKDTKILLSLNLDKLTLEWLNDSMKVMGSIKVDGRRISDVEKDLHGTLRDGGLDPNKFIGKIHYKIPNYFLKTGVFSNPDKEALNKWTLYRKLANELSALVFQYLNANGEIRV